MTAKDALSQQLSMTYEVPKDAQGYGLKKIKKEDLNTPLIVVPIADILISSKFCEAVNRPLRRSSDEKTRGRTNHGR